MFKASVVTVRDPFNPLRNREFKELTGKAPISAIAPKTDKPFIILKNGQAVVRADWDKPIENGDLMAVILLPQGGNNGGSSTSKILMAIVAIVVIYFTGGSAGAALGAMGSTFQQVGGMLAQALINGMMGSPSAQGSNSGLDQNSASPTYSISAQGNQARLESAIPIQYGRVRCFPDFAAAPYVEYAGNEQYLYQLMCIGVGEYDVESIQIEDTPISSFEEVEYEVVSPNADVTLFPADVSTSMEVSGQEALTSTALGPFVANAAGTQANYIAIDVVCPRGLYYYNSDGAVVAKSITFQVEAATINDSGVVTGSWTTLGTQTVSASTPTPQRYSFRYSVTPARYQVRLTRLDAKDTSNQAGHELDWVGLRTYLVGSQNFGNVTLLAVKMRATNNLSAQASRKFNVICTRKLYHWTGAAWAGPSATRSVAWALADACKTVGIPDSRIDLDELVAIDATLSARGDTFDGRFDSTGTFWDALTKIARAGRCKPFMQGGIVYFRRDESVSMPVAMFSNRNIVKNSLSIQYATPTDETADSVEVSYFDQSTWKTMRMVCSLPSSTSVKPAKVELFGVVNREQAYREGIYYAAANRYRRKFIKFSTEMEGFIPSYGDLIAISHDLPQWGQPSECVAWDSSTKTLTLSEPMGWGTGTHYVGLRKRDGSLSGPYEVTAGANAYKVVLAASPDFTPYTGKSEERTHVYFGWGETWRQLARIISIKPRDENTVDIVCINEDSNVHTADTGVFSPVVSSSQLTATPSAPSLSGLSARSMSGDPKMMLITWQPSPGAEYYIVEQSADGLSWTRTAETRANNITATALYASQTIIRVAAVGQLRGAWSSINYALVSDYMWSSSSSTLMWTTDSNLMWRT